MDSLWAPKRGEALTGNAMQAVQRYPKTRSKLPT
jgi:hypothetical protein